MLSPERVGTTNQETKELPQQEVLMKKQFTEQELKDRYEGAYRNEQAQVFRNERQRLKEKDEQKKQEILKSLELRKGVHDDAMTYNQEKFNHVLTFQTGEIDRVDDEIRRYKGLIDNRGFVTKLRYRFFGKEDIEQAKVNRLSEERRVMIQKIIDAKSVMEDSNREADNQLESSKQTIQDREMSLSSESKVAKGDLLQRVRKSNQLSREALRNTVEALNTGSLDIKKLAIENNALVVHAISLDGWSTKNTSMNNTEVDTTAMSSKEKSNIVLDKAPDLSASILKVDRSIVGQNMFYPFGYILDGKIIASYQGDEGTVTTGDSRRRKEHQGTLQRKPVEQFAEVAFYAARENQGAQYNEAIVHTPKVRGVLIDEQELDRLTSFGAKKKKVFDLDKQVDVVAYHTLLSSLKKENIIRQQEGVPSSGDNKGKHMAVLEWNQTGLEKAVEYAQEHTPGAPIYFRKKDGIYTLSGEKVTARDIYKK